MNTSALKMTVVVVLTSEEFKALLHKEEGELI